MPAEMLRSARDSICSVYGVLPVLMNPATTGPAIREAQRHLASWTVQPLADLIAQEASEKLGSAVEIDVLRPLAAFDHGARARAFSGLVQGLVAAKQGGLSESEITAALAFIDQSPADG